MEGYILGITCVSNGFWIETVDGLYFQPTTVKVELESIDELDLVAMLYEE